jgi:hypothetical protein
MADDTARTEAEKGLTQSRISRRTLVKGGAVVAGTAWAAPAIESFIYKAAAQSGTTRKPPPGCPPFGAYLLSGLTILYMRGGTLYWTFIGQNKTTCDAVGSIADDGKQNGGFTTICNGNVIAVNTTGSAGVLVNGVAPINDTQCYFDATPGGADLNAAGIAAGVTIVAFIAHNGTFVGGTILGTPPHDHWEVQCGGSGVDCPPNPFAGGG